MKVFTYLIVIRLISINCQQVLYKDLRGFQNTQFTNLKILENSLDSRSSVRSTLFCNVFCLENSRCLSCAFNNIMKLCVLWDRDFIDVSTTYVVTEDGWEYYYVIKGWYILTVMRFISAVSKCCCFIKPVHEPLSFLSTVETRCLQIEDLLFLLELSEYSRHVKYCLQ